MSRPITTKRLSLLSYRAGLGLLAVCSACLLGCGGSEPEVVEPAPTADAPAMPGMVKQDSSEDAAGDKGGQAYGGGAYSDDGGAISQETPYSEMSSMDQMRMMSEGKSPGMPSSDPTAFYMGGAGDESGMGGYAMGGAAGGNAGPQFATAMQFVRSNCISCHGPQQTQGEVRLDVLTDDLSHTGNATAWHAVLEQLESGQMPPASVPQRPDAKQQSAVQAWIKSALIKADFVPLPDRDYLSQAEYAYSTGKEAQAVKLLYAQAIAADADVAAETLSQTRWSTLNLRPALVLRFAVGVAVDAPEGLSDLKPIGVSQAGGGGGGYGGAMAGMGMSPGGPNEAGSTERTFQQLTGDFGAALATSFESRWMAGKLGTPFKDVEPAAAPAASASGMNSMGMMGNYGGEMAGGMAGGGGYGGGAYPGADGGGGPGSAKAANKPITKGTVATPGLVFIGTGSQTELLQQAKDQGYDGLFLFEVKAVHKRRGNLIENSTRLRFMGLDGKNVAATGTLVNVDIERDKLRGIDNDAVGKNIDRFFASFDEKVAMTDLPALKPEHAQDRIRQLLVDPQVSNLMKLFEARLYHSMQLLTDNELAQVYQIILRGNEGLALASGTLADRRLVLDAVLAGQ